VNEPRATGPSGPVVDPLATTFIELTRSVAGGAPAAEVFMLLAERCTELLPIDACGILLVDHNGRLEVVGASDSAAYLLDLFQLQAEEGPCLECCRTGELVRDDELAPDGPWPRFAAATPSRGFTSVAAVPLGTRGTTLGALNTFCSVPLPAPDLEVAQALADAATVALLQADPELDADTIARRVVETVAARNVVEQAIGIVAARFDCSFPEALGRLRRASTVVGATLVDTATAVVHRIDTAATTDLFRGPVSP